MTAPFRFRLDYAGSAAAENEYPRWDLREIVLAGRSNVGKSSLLNALGGSRHLARVSRTPGRTRRIHFFADRSVGIALVDLPGYGFARASKSDREKWGTSVEAYLESRVNLVAIAMLLDVRRDPEEDERLLEAFAAGRSLRVLRVATKIDKLGRAERERRFRALDAARGPWLGVSAETGDGIETLCKAIRKLAALA